MRPTSEAEKDETAVPTTMTDVETEEQQVLVSGQESRPINKVLCLAHGSIEELGDASITIVSSFESKATGKEASASTCSDRSDDAGNLMDLSSNYEHSISSDDSSSYFSAQETSSPLATSLERNLHMDVKEQVFVVTDEESPVVKDSTDGQAPHLALGSLDFISDNEATTCTTIAADGSADPVSNDVTTTIELAHNRSASGDYGDFTWKSRDIGFDTSLDNPDRGVKDSDSLDENESVASDSLSAADVVRAETVITTEQVLIEDRGTNIEQPPTQTDTALVTHADKERTVDNGVSICSEDDEGDASLNAISVVEVPRETLLIKSVHDIAPAVPPTDIDIEDRKNNGTSLSPVAGSMVMGSTVMGSTVMAPSIVSMASSVEEQPQTRHDNKQCRCVPTHTQAAPLMICVMVALIIALSVIIAATTSSDDGQNIDVETTEPTKSPTIPPSIVPTRRHPSGGPTLQPTMLDPTFVPTAAPTTLRLNMPTNAPTSAPMTPSPTTEQTRGPPFVIPGDLVRIQNAVRSVSLNPKAMDDRNSAEFFATEFMYEAVKHSNAWTVGRLVGNNGRLRQLYAMTVLDVGLSGLGTGQGKHTGTPKSMDALGECNWEGILCNNGKVTKIVWPDEGLTGHLPADVGLLTSVTMLDVAENQIHGTIPSELFRLTNLQYLYMHGNSLEGTISEAISKSSGLVNVYLGSNRLTGSIPKGFGSRSGRIHPLRKLTLNNNHLHGTIPAGLRLQNLYYLDLGSNRLNGTIPTDWWNSSDTSMESLRHLYLDNNTLTGELDTGFVMIGKGRIINLNLSFNNFTGRFPGRLRPMNLLESLEIQRGGFDGVDRNLCPLSVFGVGELATFRSDCATCPCGYPFCRPGRCLDT